MFWLAWTVCVAVSIVVMVVYLRREYGHLAKRPQPAAASPRRTRVRLSQVPLDDCPSEVIADIASKLPPPSSQVAD